MDSRRYILLFGSIEKNVDCTHILHVVEVKGPGLAAAAAPAAAVLHRFRGEGLVTAVYETKNG